MRPDDFYLQTQLNNHPCALLIFISAIFIGQLTMYAYTSESQIDVRLHASGLVSIILQVVLVYYHHRQAAKSNARKIVKLNQISIIIQLFYSLMTANRYQNAGVILQLLFCMFLYVLAYNDSIMKLLGCMLISTLLTRYTILLQQNPLCFIIVILTYLAILQSFHLLFSYCNKELQQARPVTAAMNKMTYTLINAIVNALPSKLLPRVLQNQSLPCDIIPDVCYVYIHLKTDNSELEDVDSERSKLYLSRVNQFYCILDYLSEICNIQKVKSSYSYFMACVGAQEYLVGGQVKIREKNYPNSFDYQKLLIFFALAAQLTAKLLDLKCAAGITRGSIVLGVLGQGSDTLNFDTYGDTVNTAARIAINADEGVHLAIEQFVGKSAMHRIDSKIYIQKNYAYNDYFKDNDIYMPSLLFLLQSQPCYMFGTSSTKEYKGKGELRTVQVDQTAAFINILFTVMKKSNACALLESLNQQDQQQFKQIDLMNELINIISQQDASDSLNVRVAASSEISTADADIGQLQVMLDKNYIFLDSVSSLDLASLDFYRYSRNQLITAYSQNESMQKELIDFYKMALQRRLDESESDDAPQNLSDQIEHKKLFSLSNELNRSGSQDNKFYKDFDEVIPQVHNSYNITLDAAHYEALVAKQKIDVAHLLDDDIDLIEIDEGSPHINDQITPFSQQNLFTIFSSHETSRPVTTLYKLHTTEESESEVMDSKFFYRNEKVKVEVKQTPVNAEPQQDTDVHYYDKYFFFAYTKRENYFVYLFKMLELIVNLTKETLEYFKKSDTYLSINLKPLNSQVYFLITTTLISSALVVMLVLYAHVQSDTYMTLYMFTLNPLDMLLALNIVLVILFMYQVVLRYQLLTFLNNLQKKTTKISQKQKMQFYKTQIIYYQVSLFLVYMVYIIQIIAATDDHMKTFFDIEYSVLLYQGVTLTSYLLNVFLNLSFVAVPNFMLTSNFESIIVTQLFMTFVLVRRMPIETLYILAFCLVMYATMVPLITLNFYSNIESIKQVISINRERYLLTGILPRITIDSLLATSSPEVLQLLIQSFPFLQKYRNRLFQLYDVSYTLEHEAFRAYADLRQQRYESRAYTYAQLFERMYFYLRIPNYRLLEPTRPVINFENAAYLNLDIANFTEFSSQLPVETMMRFLNSLFKRFDQRLARSKNLMQIKISGDSYEIMSFPCIIKMYPTLLAEKEHFDLKIPPHILKIFRTPEDLRKSYDSIVVLVATALGFIRDCELTIAKIAPQFRDLVHLRVGISFGNVIGSLLGNKYSRFDTFGQVPREAERIYSLARLDTVAISRRVFDIITYGYIYFKSHLLSKISQIQIAEGQQIAQENELVEFNYIPYKGQFCIDSIVAGEVISAKLKKSSSMRAVDQAAKAGL